MGLSSFLSRFSLVNRDRNGNVTYSFLDNQGFENSNNYLKASFDNPVLMAIIALRSKVYSQMKITHLNSNGEEIANSPIVRLFKQPNYFQSQEDFFFQQMWFLSATGNNLTYKVETFNGVKSLYNLLPSNVDLNDTDKVSKLITTDQDFRKIGDKHIIYTLENETYNYKVKDLIPFYDLANGLTDRSFMSSPSRVKSIMHILENIQENINSKNINLKMSQKYLASSKGDGNEAQIQDNDRKDIFRKINQKWLTITNSSMDVKHLVSDMKRLYLDEQFSEDALKCLLVFDMNKDVLNYFSNGASTYENLNQSVIHWIQNFVQLDATNTMNSFSSQFGLFDKGEKLVASYNHLPVMAKLIDDKVTSFKSLQESLKIALEIGTISAADAIQMSKEFKLNIGL